MLVYLISGLFCLDNAKILYLPYSQIIQRLDKIAFCTINLNIILYLSRIMLYLQYNHTKRKLYEYSEGYKSSFNR